MLIIDTHCHAGLSWFEPIEVLEFQMDRVGVDKAALIQHRGAYDSSYLFGIAALQPEKYRVVVLVDPSGPDPLVLLEREAEKGAAGLRFYSEQKFTTVSQVEIARKAGQLGLPITVLGELEGYASAEFMKLIDDCPDTQFIVEHLARGGRDRPPWDTYKAALKAGERPNALIKVPGLGEVAERPEILGTSFGFDNVPALFEMALEAFGPQRMMWGSDFPPSAYREGYANTLEGVRTYPAFAGGDDLEWILGRTAARVFGFDQAI